MKLDDAYNRINESKKENKDLFEKEDFLPKTPKDKVLKEAKKGETENGIKGEGNVQ